MLRMKINDRKILKDLRKGDIKAFESLFHHFHPGLSLYAINLLKDSTIAEEVIQDVFYNIWKNRNEFWLKTNWQSYLYKAVYNNCMMEIRKVKKEIRTDENWMQKQEGNAPDPSGELEEVELSEAILKTLEIMPERTREIFNLSRFEGMKYKEIAKKLAISVKTVEANMSKALKTFRTSLKEYGY